jgi:hypothetical protein
MPVILHRFDVQSDPDNLRVPHTLDGNPTLKKRQTINSRSIPFPLSPDSLTLFRDAQQLSVDVGHEVEHLGPVRAQLRVTTESTAGVHRELTFIVGRETC